MLEVCKGWVKGPFAGARGNDKVAPIQERAALSGDGQASDNP
jgi:hypothetical protein